MKAAYSFVIVHFWSDFSFIFRLFFRHFGALVYIVFVVKLCQMKTLPMDERQQYLLAVYSTILVCVI